MNHKVGKPAQAFIPLHSAEIRYAGQYVAVVIAETLEQAQHAADAIKISYAKQSVPAVSTGAAMHTAYEPKQMGRRSKPTHKRGGPDGALATAVVKNRADVYDAD